jgi:predicted enzyme related to lactoylglutathione lyase
MLIPEVSMKRFHLHVHVQDLQASIRFYVRLFAAEPTREAVTAQVCCSPAESSPARNPGHCC